MKQNKRIILVACSGVDTFCHYLPQENDYFIGVDKGAITLLEKGYPVDLAIGDFDSCTPTEKEIIKTKCKQIKEYPVHKDETDLELALMKLADGQEVYIYNAVGKRLDHEMVNFFFLKKYARLKIHLISTEEEITYIEKTPKTPDCLELALSNTKRFSLLAFFDAICETKDAIYPMEKKHLTFEDTFTTSNQATPKTRIILSEGAILLFESLK
jgi:thiamine pyrophosphokinase